MILQASKDIAPFYTRFGAKTNSCSQALWLQLGQAEAGTASLLEPDPELKAMTMWNRREDGSRSSEGADGGDDDDGDQAADEDGDTSRLVELYDLCAEAALDDAKTEAAPVTLSPVTPSPVTPSPATPSPVTPSPVTPSPGVPTTAHLPPATKMRTRRWERDISALLCKCGRGVAFKAVELAAKEDRTRLDAATPRVLRSRLEAVPDLARSYVEKGWVVTNKSRLKQHLSMLEGAWRAPPGIVKRALIDAADAVDSSELPDRQYESLEGKLKEMVPLEDLKSERDVKAEKSGKSADLKGYRRPTRRHRGMAHECNLHHARLDFYGKSWIRGKGPDGVSNAERLAHCLEMRHFHPAHQALLDDAKEVFWTVLNEASKNAIYNSCVVMDSEGDEHVKWHSDTLTGSPDSPYVDGAAIIVVMKGMRQMLHTRGMLNGPFHSGKKTYDFETTGIPAIELEDGCAYVLPAGEIGSVDWLVEHMTWPHVEGPGAELEGVERPRRRAWVFRAIKPSHAQWYDQVWPHRMCPPSIAAKLYGASSEGGDSVWG